MKKVALAAVALMAMLAFGTVAVADSGKVRATPFTFDPDRTGIIVSAWTPGTGLPDPRGVVHNGLVLEKNGATSTNAAGGAVISGAAGSTLSEVGYDIKDGTHCGAGAPRFNLEASDGFHFLGGCSNATRTPSPRGAGWTEVRIDPTNSSQAFPTVAPSATVISLAILFDEGTDTPTSSLIVTPGKTVIDNVDVNGTLIGRPGNAP